MLTKDKYEYVRETDSEELFQVIDQSNIFILERIRFNTEQTGCDVVQRELTIQSRFVIVLRFKYLKATIDEPTV